MDRRIGKGMTMTMTTENFCHSRKNLLQIIVLLGFLLGVFVVAAVFGAGFDKRSGDLFWAWGLGLLLSAIIAAFGYLLWRNPCALVVDERGIYIPMTFKRPLRWDEIHRIRRLRTRRRLHGQSDWLIMDLSPGLLAPLRLPVWRRLELWLQKTQGVRIPLHGLEADPEDVVRSVERFRPVVTEVD